MDKHWITVQKKTFTNWVNALLEKHEQHQSEGLVVSDLYTDLSDGLKLIRLLEVLTDTRVKTKLHIPAKMKYHKLDNMKTAFDMIFSKKIKLENIGLEDIVDENPKLILGLVWTLISNFSLAKVLVENRSGNDALLFWVQKETQGYPNVDVQNFTTSFQDGLAFCALMHKRVPESIGDFNALKPENKIENLRLAFDAANNWYGIPFLLDPADIASHQPDEKSILTYLSWVYDKLTNDQPFDRRKAEEERQRRLREEAERARKLAEEEEEQRRRLEQLRLQAEEEERLAREREARMRQMEEERKRLEEEAERLRRQREEEEERLRKQREEQERLRKQQEEEERLRRQREEEDRRRREAEEAAKRERERLKQALTQQLQSSVDGEWIIGRTAGGNPDYFTYRINPTYEFKLSNLKPTTHNQPLRFRVTLESRDGGAIFEHAAAAGNRTDNSVGIQVLKLPKDTYELPSVLTSAMTMLNAYAHHQAPANRASLTQQFEIDRASLADLASGAYKLVVVPSTYHPTQGPYRLSIGAAIDSDADLDAVRASQLYGVSLRPEGAETGSLPSPFKTKYYITGRWISGQTSGGMHDLATWRNNPQYMLRIRRTTRFRVVLSQPPTTVNNAKLNSISFDVVRNHDDNITERVLPAHDILASPGVEHKLGKISYKPRAEVALDFTIQYDPQAERDGGMLIFIVPSCWEPEQEGPFLLSILTDQPDLNDIKYVGGAKENSKFEVSVPGEWKGPSAGGPYTAPTWRQNPQFRLRITQPTQLSILLARTDYKFAFDAEAGLSYMEKKHIGICFYVARNRDPTISDQLLPSCQIVKKPKSFIQHSEVAMNLTLDDPNCTYFIVPCTYNPGEECAFKITAFSQTPVHLEPVFRNPNAQVSLRGEWRGRTAGGSTSAPTWRNNPAFRLKLRRPCKISVILQQQVAMTTTTNSSSSLQSIGLRVVKNKDQRFDRELVSNYVVVSEAREDDFTYFAKAEISTEVTFPTPHECNDTYFIVPSMFEPGVEGTFALSVVALGGFAVSDVIAEFVPVGGPHYFHTAVRSAWAGPTAGGCRNFNTWKMNPKIGLFVSQPRTLASITLAQDVDPSGMRPLKAISFFIMRNRNPRIDPRDLETFFDPLYGFERLAEVKEGDYIYVAKREVTLEYEFAEPGQYFIVPSTFNAGDECAFTLMCSATAPVDMRAV